MVKVEQVNGKWSLVRNGEIISTHDTIRDAFYAKAELAPRRDVIGFKADGTEITKTARSRRSR